MPEFTQLLDAAAAGDRHAAAQILPLVYDELRKLAAAKMAAEKPGNTLDATALVHEAYLRLARDQHFDGRWHFFAAAAQAMRRILVEKARRKKRVKHGGDRVRVEPEVACSVPEDPGEDLLALDAALNKLASTHPDKAQVVQLRYFAGLTMPKIAQVMKISLATAERHWTYARTWLYAELSDPEDSPGA
jgi:RNA polymerase sigma factor (TIGR02999 family)